MNNFKPYSRSYLLPSTQAKISAARRKVRRAANIQAEAARLKQTLYQRLQEHDPREPRPELVLGVQHNGPITVPRWTLTPSNDFDLPRVTIDAEEDVRRFIRHSFGADYRAGEDRRYFCPRHPNLEDLTVTLVEHPGVPPLVHCSRCGYRLGALDFLDEVSTAGLDLLQMAARIWPEKIASGKLDAAEISRIALHAARGELLKQGRWLYAAKVVEEELRPTFGDWAAIYDDCLPILFSRDEIPVEVRQPYYLLRLLRSWAGEIVAVDVYSREYLPLFRHWLSSRTNGDLFVVPRWADFCDRTGERQLCDRAEVAHALERESIAVPAESRKPIWLRCSSQPQEGGGVC